MSKNTLPVTNTRQGEIKKTRIIYVTCWRFGCCCWWCILTVILIIIQHRRGKQFFLAGLTNFAQSVCKWTSTQNVCSINLVFMATNLLWGPLCYIWCEPELIAGAEKILSRMRVYVYTIKYGFLCRRPCMEICVIYSTPTHIQIRCLKAASSGIVSNIGRKQWSSTSLRRIFGLIFSQVSSEPTSKPVQ